MKQCLHGESTLFRAVLQREFVDGRDEPVIELLRDGAARPAHLGGELLDPLAEGEALRRVEGAQEACANFVDAWRARLGLPSTAATAAAKHGNASKGGKGGARDTPAVPSKTAKLVRGGRGGRGRGRGSPVAPVAAKVRAASHGSSVKSARGKRVRA